MSLTCLDSNQFLHFLQSLDQSLPANFCVQQAKRPGTQRSGRSTEQGAAKPAKPGRGAQGAAGAEGQAQHGKIVGQEEQAANDKTIHTNQPNHTNHTNHKPDQAAQHKTKKRSDRSSRHRSSHGSSRNSSDSHHHRRHAKKKKKRQPEALTTVTTVVVTATNTVIDHKPDSTTDKAESHELLEPLLQDQDMAIPILPLPSDILPPPSLISRPLTPELLIRDGHLATPIPVMPIQAIVLIPGMIPGPIVQNSTEQQADRGSQAQSEHQIQQSFVTSSSSNEQVASDLFDLPDLPDLPIESTMLSQSSLMDWNELSNESSNNSSESFLISNSINPAAVSAAAQTTDTTTLPVKPSGHSKRTRRRVDPKLPQWTGLMFPHNAWYLFRECLKQTAIQSDQMAYRIDQTRQERLEQLQREFRELLMPSSSYNAYEEHHQSTHRREQKNHVSTSIRMAARKNATNVNTSVNTGMTNVGANANAAGANAHTIPSTAIANAIGAIAIGANAIGANAHAMPLVATIPLATMATMITPAIVPKPIHMDDVIRAASLATVQTTVQAIQSAAQAMLAIPAMPSPIHDADATTTTDYTASHASAVLPVTPTATLDIQEQPHLVHAILEHYKRSPMPARWVDLQIDTLNGLRLKLLNEVRNYYRTKDPSKVQGLDMSSTSSTGLSSTALGTALGTALTIPLTEQVVRNALKDAAIQYRLDVAKQVLAWHEQLYSSMTDEDETLSVQETVSDQSLRCFWLLFLGMVAKTAQIEVESCLRAMRVKSKNDMLLTRFKLNKVQLSVVDIALLGQIQAQYPKQDIDSKSVPIGNGAMFSRQPKTQQLAHQQVLALASSCLELNTSDQKRLTSRVTAWFDKAQVEFLDVTEE